MHIDKYIIIYLCAAQSERHTVIIVAPYSGYTDMYLNLVT